jgi:CheY-like chemotaxis protein
MRKETSGPVFAEPLSELALSEKDPARRLRQDPETIEQVLDRLDEHTAQRRTANVRESDRHQYRTRMMVVELAQHGTGWVRYEVAPRNLSQSGVAFLLGHFVYPQTPCRVQLVDRQKRKHVIRGEVVRCRYLEDSATLHEVGVRFAEQISIGVFSGNATRLRFLMVDNDPAIRRLVGHVLKSLGVELTSLDDGRQAVETATTDDFDLVLLDMEFPECDGFEIARELRHRGFRRPIVAVTARKGEQARGKCLEAGCSNWVPKPITPETLTELVESLRVEPLVSLLADDPDTAPLIDTFVMELPERISRLENSFGQRDYETLTRLIRMLKSEGSAYGFQPIADAAGRVEDAISREYGDATILERLDELIRTCLSASPTI